MVVALTAAAGFVAGHAAGYAVVYPQGSARAATMHATGHGYWGAATAVAVAAGLAALATTGWRAASATGVKLRLAPLVAGQVALFAAAEAGERVLEWVQTSTHAGSVSDKLDAPQEHWERHLAVYRDEWRGVLLSNGGLVAGWDGEHLDAGES